MKNAKLIEGLKMLDRKEWISFRKYVLMYCTKTSDKYRLVNYLYTVSNSIVELTNIDVIKKPLFEKMSTKSFLNLMSRIYIWFEEWLVWYENKKDTTACDIQLVKIYNRKGVYSLADKTYKKVEKRLLEVEQLDLRKHKDLYELHHYHCYSDNPAKHKRKGEILETLISYFLLQFKEQALMYISEMHNWGDIQNHDYTKEIELLRLVETLIDDSETSEVIQWISIMVSELDEKAFLTVRDVVYSGRLKTGSDLYILASLYMINFSMKLWNANKIKDPQIVLDVYDFGLESGVLFSTGKIPLLRFLNLISTLGYIKTSVKTYEFIDKWIYLVDTNNHNAIQALAYAHLKFIEKKYEDIVPLLVGKKYTTDIGKLRASSLELISLYSDRHSNYSLLMNRLNNFKRVLKTYHSKKSNEAFYSYSNFAKILTLLVKRDFIKMTIDIEKYSPIIYNKWLKEEIKAGQK